MQNVHGVLGFLHEYAVPLSYGLLHLLLPILTWKKYRNASKQKQDFSAMGAGLSSRRWLTENLLALGLFIFVSALYIYKTIQIDYEMDQVTSVQFLCELLCAVSHFCCNGGYNLLKPRILS